MYEGYISRSVVAWYLVMPHIGHTCVLLPVVKLHVRHLYMLVPLIIPHIRHVNLCLYIAVSLQGKTTRILSFGCGFACDTTIGCAGFRLSFGIIFLL